MVFSGIGVLLTVSSLSDPPVKVILTTSLSQAAKEVGDVQDDLVDLFKRIENFFKRLESYTHVPQTEAMTDIIIKIMVEVLNILALATMTVKRGRAGASVLPGD